MTTKINTNELRNQLKAAEGRQRELALEHANLEADTREAMQQAAQQRAIAARRGEDATTTAADLDVSALRDRAIALPFELWAARITTAQIARDLHQAELEEATAESQQAGQEFAIAQREAQEAEKARDAAYAAYAGAGARVNQLRGKLREDVRTLQRLEGEAPGA